MCTRQIVHDTNLLQENGRGNMPFEIGKARLADVQEDCGRES